MNEKMFMSNITLFRNQVVSDGSIKSLQTVQALLDERRKEHISQYMETELHRNAAHELKKQLDALLAEQAHFKDSKLKEYHEKEREHASLLAMIRAIESRINELVLKRNKQRQLISTLEVKLAKIKQFDELTVLFCKT